MTLRGFIYCLVVRLTARDAWLNNRVANAAIFCFFTNEQI